MYNFRLYNRSQSRNQRFAFNRLHLEGEREHWVSHKRRWRVSNLLLGKWKSVPECWNFSKKRTQWSVLFYNFTTITFYCSSALQLLPASWLIALVVLPNLARMVALSKDQSPSVLILTNILSVQHTIINHSWIILTMIKSMQLRNWMFTVSLINNYFSYSASIENFY